MSRKSSRRSNNTRAASQRRNTKPAQRSPEQPLEIADVPPEDLGQSSALRIDEAPEIAALEGSPRARQERGRAEADSDEGKGLIAFLRSVWAELQRVQWPNRQQVGLYTWVVILFVAVAGAYLGLLDVAFQHLIDVLT